MVENKITIRDNYGSKETLEILCSFDYNGKHYFIAKDPLDDEWICRQMRWSFFKGTYQIIEPIPERVFTIAKNLIQKSSEDPDHFELNGEHYRVKWEGKYGERRWRYINQCCCSNYFLPLMLHFSVPVSFAISMIMAASYAFLYLESSGIMWATTVFPHMFRIPLKVMMYAIELIGAAILFKIRDEERDIWALFLNTLIPLNLITLIGAAKVNLIARIIIICAGVLFLVFKGIPLALAVASKGSKRIKKKRVHRALRKMYVPILVCVICCIYAVSIFGLDGYMYIASTKAPYTETETIMRHYSEATESINENIWKDLSAQQRIDVLQSICDYECADTFGCKTATVQAGHPQSKYIFGEYNHITNTILINIDHMNDDSVHDVVETLLHETRHVYQYSVINMLNNVEEKLDEDDMRLSIFQYASSMRDNFDNYKSGLSNFEDYYSQAAEEDSRSWAEVETCERYDAYIYIDSKTEEK